VSNVPTQSRHIADLGSRDQVAGFRQRLSMLDHPGIQNDTVDRDGSADKEFLSSYFEGGHFLNGSYIQQRVDGGMPALFEVEQ
jgi:hypothetical protein